MNKINLIFDRTDWRPTYIMSGNHLVIKQNADFFTSTQIPIFLSWQGARRAKLSSVPHLNLFLKLLSPDFSEDLSTGVGAGSTITYGALQLAYYMGANPVIIVGVDHKFTAEGRANQIRKMRGPDVNHFDPNYFRDGSYWGVPNLEASEEAYQRARYAFEAAGRKIYDATIGGQLDVFEKLDIGDALEISAKASA